jgi:hypothetical protein
LATSKIKRAESTRAEIFKRYIAGIEPDQIQDELGLDASAFDIAMRDLLESISAKLAAQPIEHVYAQYMMDMLALSARLGKIANSQNTHSRDAVAAVRGQIEVRSALLNEARKMGVVRVATNSSDDIVSYIESLSSDEIKNELRKLAAKFTELDALASKTKVAPDSPIFHGESVFDAPANTPTPKAVN